MSFILCRDLVCKVSGGAVRDLVIFKVFVIIVIMDLFRHADESAIVKVMILSRAF